LCADKERADEPPYRVGLWRLDTMAITADMHVDDVMQQWPATLRVFLDFRMRCIGCPIARFHTVADAAREHDVDGERLLLALRARTGDGPAPAFPSPPAGEQAE
jgi:hybrid cluster-associated redox disulfide protein